MDNINITKKTFDSLFELLRDCVDSLDRISIKCPNVDMGFNECPSILRNRCRKMMEELYKEVYETNEK